MAITTPFALTLVAAIHELLEDILIQNIIARRYIYPLFPMKITTSMTRKHCTPYQ